MENNKQSKSETIIGYILLTPALISVLLFLLNLIAQVDALNAFKFSGWSGDYSSQGGGYTSALPIYIGLMAIAGVYLIKKRSN